jgi:periplasmic copper chaperone A
MSEVMSTRLPSVPQLLRAALCVSLLGPAVAYAQVTITDPWVRGTVPSQMSTGAFMTLTAAKPARLVGATSPVASVVELHEMALENNVMRMRAVDSLDLPAGRSVALRPGGYHVMLIDLNRQLKPGETVLVTLQIEQDGKRQTIEVKAPVRPLTAREHKPAGAK